MNTGTEIWSTPADAPLIPPFPFSFRSAEILTVSYRTDPNAVARILPAPLQPRSSWVLIHLYNMRDVDYLGSYGECNVMVEAELEGRVRGGFSPFLFLNSDAGLAQGREVHGQPKKYGNARVEFRGDLLVGLLERNGIDVITATMAYKQRRGDLQELKDETFDFSANINLKLAYEIDGSISSKQLTVRRLESVHVHECWSGPCSVELSANMQAPVFLLPVLETGKGYFWKADFTLVPGETVHRYSR